MRNQESPERCIQGRDQGVIVGYALEVLVLTLAARMMMMLLLWIVVRRRGRCMHIFEQEDART